MGTRSVYISSPVFTLRTQLIPRPQFFLTSALKLERKPRGSIICDFGVLSVYSKVIIVLGLPWDRIGKKPNDLHTIFSWHDGAFYKISLQ